ncbi:MAG: class I SAM-dependent RNA methyltransferase [Lachnospiraceae bacterium]|nr:class I SAM-dependent RNA methyltransferase [Lachnospiraceae bacterium]
MEKMSLIAPCHFGLEAVLKKEIYDLGYDIESVSDGRVTFLADAEGLCRSNIGLRSAERVLIKVGSFTATTFDELFEGVKALHWEDYIPEDGKFWVKKASSVKSKLFSPRDIQSIVKKAIVDRLKGVYNTDWFTEEGNEYPLRVSIMKDEVTIGLDTSGESLHKRGYRQFRSDAPISETLAAALLMLTPWRSDRILVDPFCGCGTFPIEAALMAANIAPGVNRDFTACSWDNLINGKTWREAFDEARDLEDINVDTDIQGYDIDGEIVKAARKNAALAGVEKLIHFQQRDVADLSHPKRYGFIVTNPPYGERISDKKDLPALYKTFGDAAWRLSDWSVYVISSYEDVERYMGRKATKNRKIYNGMMKTYYYQFIGSPPNKVKK